MKKFLNVRNVIIVVVILIIVLYIVFIRSGNPYNSKTYNLYNKLINKNSVTMKLSYEDKEQHGTTLFSSDKTENKEVQMIDTFIDKDNFSNKHIKSITIKENGKSHVYQIYYDNGNYDDFGESEDEREVNEWLAIFNITPSNSKYYVKKYKFIKGELLYTETFPEQGYMFAYKDNVLKYIEVDKEISSTGNKLLYEVELSEDTFVDEEYQKLLEGLTLKEEDRE